MKLQKITVAREKLFAAVLVIPYLCRVTFTSSLIYLKSRLPRLPFTSRQVYFASRFKSRLLRIMFTLRNVYRDPVYVASLPLYVTFTSHLFTSQHVNFPSRSLFFPFAWLHGSFSSLLLCVTFTSRPVCLPSRSRFAPFIFRHVHFASRELASRSLFPIYLCYVHLTCRFLNFTFTVSPVFFLLRSLRFSFSRFMFTFFPVYLETRSFRPTESSPCSFCTSFTN